MKSFVVAALLVAAVAGQSMDVMRMTKDKYDILDVMKMTPKHELMKKLGYPMVDRTFTYGQETDLPLFLQEEIMDKKVLHLNELMSHPLFHEYMSLPLFRQMFQTYHMFQKYVCSIYFQKFWQIPTFKQYFVNPVLFYKYIYPVVTLFKTDVTIPTTTFGMDDLYKRDMIVNKNVFPFVTGYERDLYYPSTYTTTTTKDDLYYKALLNKVYNHLYFNNKQVVDPITGEFKMVDFDFLPTNVYGDKMDTIYGDKIFGDKVYNKDWILKKMLLNKMIHGDETFKTVLPQEDMILREKMMNMNTKMNPLVARMLFGLKNEQELPFVTEKFDTTFDHVNKFDLINKMDLIKKDLIKKELIKKELIKDDEFLPFQITKDLEKKMILNKMFNEKFNNIDTTFGTYETVPKMVDMVSPMMGVRTFDKKFTIPEVIKA